MSAKFTAQLSVMVNPMTREKINARYDRDRSTSPVNTSAVVRAAIVAGLEAMAEMTDAERSRLYAEIGIGERF